MRKTNIMKISSSLLAAFTMGTTFIAVTASSSNIHLRGGNIPLSTQQEKNLNHNNLALNFLNDHAHDRDLQADFICSHIENAFDGDVACECSIQWTSMQVDFQCVLLEPACISDTVMGGTLCGKPQYSGKLMLHPLEAAAKWENDVCVEFLNHTDSTSHEDGIVSGNLCIEADFCFQWGQEGGFSICGCAATFQDMPCQCTTCTLDDGGTGITLECLGVRTPVCLPLSFPESASEANSVKPFIPILTAHHPQQ